MHALAQDITAGDLEHCTLSLWRSLSAGIEIHRLRTTRYELLIELPRGGQAPREGTAVRLAPSLCAAGGRQLS